MSNTLTLIKLIGGKFLVKGQDEDGVFGQEVLYSPRWNEVVARTTYALAGVAYDAEVEKFFAPLLNAAKAVDAVTANPDDKWTKYVVQSKVKGVEEKVIELDPDGVLLYILQEEPQRLRWVKMGNDITELQALA